MGRHKHNTIEESYNAGRMHYLFDIKMDIRYYEKIVNTGRNDWDEEVSQEKIEEAKEKLKTLYADLNDEKKIDYHGRSATYGWKRPERHQDNPNLYEHVDRSGYKSYITSETLSKSPRIRVPSLKRKNAWKRFYKNYPELKGVEVITGRTESSGNQLNHSTIKLKKI